MRRLVYVVLILALGLPAGTAAAQAASEEEKASQSLYKKGKVKFDAGDWIAAEDLFTKSLAVFANPYARLYRAASLARLARCDESRGELARFSPDQVAAKARDKARTMVEQVKAMCAAAAVKAVAPAVVDAPVAQVPAIVPPATDAVEPSPVVVVEPPPPVPEKGKGRAGGGKGPLLVSPDGTGDFVRLEDALAKAKPGALIRLSPGLHRLSKPLDIPTAVRIVGDGKSSVIVGDGEGHVLRFVGKGPFELHDLSVEHQGGRWARVIVVEGGDVDFRGIRVSGGVRDAAARRGGEGLLMLGNAAGTITGSEFTGNALHGVKLAGRSHPLLDGNGARSNGKGGIVWFEDAGGTARANTCTANGQYGMAVVDRAAPKLVANVCVDNLRGGLYLESGRLDGLDDNRCPPYQPK
jgi:parallel beta-helix repeat protein